MITVAEILFSVTAPTVYRDGIFWYNPEAKTLKVFEGGRWQDGPSATSETEIEDVKARLDTLESKKSLSFSIVSELPAVSAADESTIYFKTIAGASGNNTHEEYVIVTVNNEKKWEKIGLADVDTSNFMKADGSNYSAVQKILVTPGITGVTWAATNASGTAVTTTGWGASVQVEPGITVTSCKAKFTNPTPNSSQASPTSCSGDFGTILPAVGGTSAEKTIMTNVTSNTTKTVTFYKPKSGLLVSGGAVVPASGSDSKSNSVSITFTNKVYWGIQPTSKLLTAAEVMAMSKGFAGSAAIGNKDFACTNHYTYLVVPNTYATPTIKFGVNSVTWDNKGTVDVVNSSGSTVTYKVLVSKQPYESKITFNFS